MLTSLAFRQRIRLRMALLNKSVKLRILRSRAIRLIVHRIGVKHSLGGSYCGALSEFKCDQQ